MDLTIYFEVFVHVRKRWPPVLRDPHQMQVDFKYSVRASPILPIPEVYPPRTR
jgi:hypothetical protein